MATPFVLLTSKIAQFREDFHLVVVRVEIFGGESLAAPWRCKQRPSRHPTAGHEEASNHNTVLRLSGRSVSS
jgi:hypothetical protein